MICAAASRSGALRCGHRLARSKLHAGQRRVSVSTMASKRIIALDFDGVVCDSVGESSLSGFKAAAKQWPEIFDTPEAEAKKPELVEKMRAVRPVVETGLGESARVRLSEKMRALLTLFGSVRDDWIATDLAGWLAPNQIYEGVTEPIRAAMDSDELYIVTTKQAHYTEKLMSDMAGINFPMDRIFSQTMSGRPKGEVLQKLADAHPEARQKIFVEDKLSTLEKVNKDESLNSWDLYLVDWGYNTAAERERAAANPRITVITVEQFKSLLAV
eukprot:gene26047-11745_t